MISGISYSRIRSSFRDQIWIIDPFFLALFYHHHTTFDRGFYSLCDSFFIGLPVGCKFASSIHHIPGFLYCQARWFGFCWTQGTGFALCGRLFEWHSFGPGLLLLRFSVIYYFGISFGTAEFWDGTVVRRAALAPGLCTAWLGSFQYALFATARRNSIHARFDLRPTYVRIVGTWEVRISMLSSYVLS
ncbi:hypothetical protein BDV95DRAFT_9527 [Massariosphaeria phaeospora]|uniref:Uncharacterized protein n=1 Tax=Massariosphaeria phaeospora TaxID=100035 RepID=A0A7C8IMP2_9PLEO|nr:hypothetical protein BDV95DRAFT_9527 [Massariosphaeria phaeospora]